MIRTLGAGALLALAAVVPAQQAAAQNPLGGAIIGGTIGGIIGGAAGRGPGGVIAGVAIGAATGAIIASEAERRNGGYFWWHNACYYRYPNGAWVQVGLNYCGY
jgi:outer membrane lipoprotein SlyB